MRPDEYDRMYILEQDFWWYRGLRSLMRQDVAQLGRGAQGSVILDAGCGTGANLAYLAGTTPAVGLDISPHALALARLRGDHHLVRGSVQQLPLRDGVCRLVLSIDVLYHSWIEDDLAVLREYWRVLAPGGGLIVHVAALEWLRGAHDEVVMTRHRYTRSELVEKVSAAGFRVRRATYRNSLLLPVMLARRALSRAACGAESDLCAPPRPINALLYGVLQVENFLLKFCDFPLGGSLYVVAHKPRN